MSAELIQRLRMRIGAPNWPHAALLMAQSADALAAQSAEVERLRAELAAQRAANNWRTHVEQRLRDWRQRTMNRSGDRLALDDFMGEDSIEDLIDFVCDEYAAPIPAAPAQAPDAGALREALRKIADWELPPSGKRWPDTAAPMSYGAAYGSNGERDYMREVARAALSATPAPTGNSDALHTFLNAAAGEGLVLDGVDAANLYAAVFPERYAATIASIEGDRTALAADAGSCNVELTGTARRLGSG